MMILYIQIILLKKWNFYIKKEDSKNKMSFGGRKSDWRFRKNQKNINKKIKISTHFGGGSIVQYEYYKEN